MMQQCNNAIMKQCNDAIMQYNESGGIRAAVHNTDGKLREAVQSSERRGPRASPLEGA